MWLLSVCIGMTAFNFLSSLLIRSHYAQFNTRLHRWYFVTWLMGMRMGIGFDPLYCAYNFFLFLASTHVAYPHFVEQDNLYKWCSDIPSLSQYAESSLCSYDCVSCVSIVIIKVVYLLDLTLPLAWWYHIMFLISDDMTFIMLVFGRVLLSVFLGDHHDLQVI